MMYPNRPRRELPRIPIPRTLVNKERGRAGVTKSNPPATNDESGPATYGFCISHSLTRSSPASKKHLPKKRNKSNKRGGRPSAPSREVLGDEL